MTELRTRHLVRRAEAGAGGPARRLGTTAVVAAVLLLGTAAVQAGSLRFLGTGTGDIDRVKIPLDAPPRPVDVGATDFTLEWWMKAAPGDNAAGQATCDAADGWITGHVLLDRDVFGDGDHGDFGVSVTGCRLAFGVSAGAAGTTICGGTDVADGAWHHVAVTRRRADGRLRIYVDGVLDAAGAGGVGPDRDVSYRDGRPTAYPDSDPFLVLGAEKHDAGPGFPSYRGYLDEVRLSTVERYTATTFTRPLDAFGPDPGTAALYHLDEGSGDVVGDATAGGSDGALRVGGDPAGPVWTVEGAPLSTTRRIALDPVLTGLDKPVGVTHAGDDRLFVVLKGGRILVHGSAGTGTFLDLSAVVRATETERGLLGLAFHPRYEENRYFFVYYTDGSGRLVIARYQTRADDPDVADADSGRVLLTIDHPDFSNHNGGALAFGPDGYLYAGIGDGGSGGDPSNHAQDRGTLLGKILRLDVDVEDPPYHAIPPTNPFVGVAGARGEIWAYGVRNPWRITFDRRTGDLFIADVGQNAREEVDFQPATGAAGEQGGRNYGWRRMEGTACYNPSTGCQTGSLVLPVLEYTHADGCSITGGYRYRGAEVPSLSGVYVFADFCNGRIWGGVQAGTGAWSRVELLDSGLSISSFGEDAAGELYVADLNGGVYRVVRPRPRLTVTPTGAGAGTVSDGAGTIQCGTACRAEYDPGATVTLQAAAGTGASFGGWGGACGGTGACALTLDGDRTVTAQFDPVSVLEFTASSYAAAEGATGAVITVRRTLSTVGTVTVDYAILPGTATPGADYVAQPPPRTLTFAPGVSTRTFTVGIGNDTTAEGGETVLLVLSHPTNGAVLGGRRTAVLTIGDNETGGSLQFGAAAYTVGEGAGAVTVTVVRSGWTAGAVSVTVRAAGGSATPGADHGLTAPVTLSFAAGQKSRTLTIPIVQDQLVEANETIVLRLEDAQGGAQLGARQTTTVTIVDDDRAGTLEFAASAYTAVASNGGAPLTLRRTGATGGPAAVDLAFLDGSGIGGACDQGADYAPVPQTVTFAPGQTARSVLVPLCPATVARPPRTFTARLEARPDLSPAFALGTRAQAQVTIVDDAIAFGASQYVAGEGATAVTLTLTRTPGTTQPATVGYAAVAAGAGPGFATPAPGPSACGPGADFRPVTGTVTLPAGGLSARLTIPLCPDAAAEGDELFTVVLTDVLAGPATLGTPAAATVLVTENDGPRVKLGAASYAAKEGAGLLKVSVLRAGTTGTAATAQLVSADGTAIGGPCGSGADYVPVSQVVAFAPGQTTRTVAIQLCNDVLARGPRQFSLRLLDAGTPLTAPRSAVVTLADDDAAGALAFGAAAYSIREDQGSAQVVVTRTGTAGGVSVRVRSGAPADTALPGVDYEGVDLVLSFAAGQTASALAVPILARPGPEGTRALTLRLESPTGGATLGARATTTLWILDAPD